jgi:hypothetical protein
MNNSNTLTVYWSPYSIPEKLYQQILLDIKPLSLLNEVQRRRAKDPVIPRGQNKPQGGNYQSCSALHTLAKNTFVILAPFDVTLFLDSNGVISDGTTHPYWFEERISSIQNSFSVDFDMPFIFFSEKSVDVKITPAYMHNLSYANTGFVVPGQFDISNWFRPMPIIFQLWEGKKVLSFSKGEPLAYISFDTDKEINLKQFNLTNDIYNQTIACTEHKLFSRFQTMEQLYNKFNRTGLKKIVLDSIKNNLI